MSYYDDMFDDFVLIVDILPYLRLYDLNHGTSPLLEDPTLRSAVRAILGNTIVESAIVLDPEAATDQAFDMYFEIEPDGVFMDAEKWEVIVLLDEVCQELDRYIRTRIRYHFGDDVANRTFAVESIDETTANIVVSVRRP